MHHVASPKTGEENTSSSVFWVRLGNSESLGFHLCSDPLQKGLQPSAAVQALVATHGSHAKGQDVHVERQQTQIWKT